jgi:hypothetical protein
MSNSTRKTVSLDPHMVVAKLNVNDAGKEDREMERLSRRHRGIFEQAWKIADTGERLSCKLGCIE